MARILLLSYAFPPFGGAASRRAAKMVKYLSRKGHTFLVITSSRIINPLVDPESLQDIPPSTEVIRTRSLEPVPAAGRERSWLLYLRRALNIPMIPDITLLWAAAAFVPAVSAARRFKPGLIIATAPEFSAFILAAALKKIFRVPMLLDYRDEWSFHPERELAASRSRLKKLKQLVLLGLEKRIAGFADLVIANTEGFREMFISRLGLAEARVRVIPNGFDPEDFPAPRKGEKEKGDLFIVTHLGSVDHESVIPPELFEALAQAGSAAGRQILFRQAGNIYPELKERLSRTRFENLQVEITGFLPARKALPLLLESDLNLMAVEDFPGKERYHNLKLFDYLYAKRPILVYGPGKGLIAKEAKESGLGVVVERGDRERLRLVLTGLVSGALRPQPRDDYIASFAWERIADSLHACILELTGQEGGA